MRRRNFHRRFVGLDGDKRLLDLDGIAYFDEQLNHGHFVEIANIWNLNVNGTHGAYS
jgi:hypothetical protein